MNIVFLFSDNFPGNSAYANRIHSLAKGLDYYNNNVEVSVVYPGNKITSANSEKEGIYNNVKFKYYAKFKFKPKSRFLQMLIGVQGIFSFFLKNLFKNKNNQPDIIISCSSGLLHLFVLYILKTIRGIQVLREYNEYPKFLQENKINFFSIRKYKLLNGFLFMTNRIKGFFENDLKINKPSVIINMTVDEDRFNDISISKTNFITLVGDVVGDKDGVECLIKSFKLISKEYPEIKLRLVGNNSNELLFQKRKVLIKELGLENKVIFTGIVNRENIPLILSESMLLLLSRPNSKLSESGFPTKLGEYLMSSTPVVVTKTGEIANFLTDKVDAFICEPDNKMSFAQSVLYALDEYEEAIEIGKRGKETAKKYFSYKTQGAKLDNFLKSL